MITQKVLLHLCLQINIHMVYSNSFGTDVNDDGRLEGVRNAQIQQVVVTTVEMTVKGGRHIYKQVQVIDFAIRPVEEDGQTQDKKSYDPQYSGRYVITKIRHRVTKQDYKMILECRKDSVREMISKKRYQRLQERTQFENATYDNYRKVTTGFLNLYPTDSRRFFPSRFYHNNRERSLNISV